MQFKKIAEDYFIRWQYPLCCGAIDGKHIRIKCPKGSGSLFFNYKEYFSTVLLALVDAQYKFIAVDIGSYGREGDAGIFLKSNLGKRILAEQYNLPAPARIPETDLFQQHVILGDEAFALHINVMKPYCKNLSLHDKKTCDLQLQTQSGTQNKRKCFWHYGIVFQNFLYAYRGEARNC